MEGPTKSSVPTESVAAVVEEGLHVDAAINGLLVNTSGDTRVSVFLLSDRVVRQGSKEDHGEVGTSDVQVLRADSETLSVAGEVDADL